MIISDRGMHFCHELGSCRDGDSPTLNVPRKDVTKCGKDFTVVMKVRGGWFDIKTDYAEKRPGKTDQSSNPSPRKGLGASVWALRMFEFCKLLNNNTL